jgi:sugar phosphate isomerase/epimerase
MAKKNLMSMAEIAVENGLTLSQVAYAAKKAGVSGVKVPSEPGSGLRPYLGFNATEVKAILKARGAVKAR